MRERFDRWGGGERRPHFASSGNRAFDDYREDTLKRLEDEARDFRQFLDRLRMAKDKAEFDQYMADRRARAASGEGQTTGEGGSGSEPSGQRPS